MRFLVRNVAVIHVAVVLCAFAWVFGGARGDLLPYFVPWTWALLLEGMICFPQCHHDESMVSARERVWSAMRQDPLVWVSIAFVVLLALPFINRALCPICDYPLIAAGADPTPPIPFLPSCLNRLEQLTVFLWFGPALTAMVAVKHALLKRGKRALLEMLVWNGVALAGFGFVQSLADAPGPFWVPQVPSAAYFFSSFGYPNQAGDYFTALFIVSVGLWRRRLEEVRASGRPSSHAEANAKTVPERDVFWRRHYLLIAAAILFFAAINTLSRSAVIMSSVAAVALFLHAGVMSLARLRRAERLKRGAWIVFAVIAIAVFGSVFTPAASDRVKNELSGLSAPEILDRVTGRSEYHTRIAARVFADNVLFGTGGWGYKHRSAPLVPESVSRTFKYEWSNGGANVHNDYLQFLVEHGLIGFAFLAAVFMLLVLPVVRVWRALARSVRFVNRSGLPPPKGFFIFPAAATAVLLAALATFLHAFYDCPFRSPAVLSLFLVELAAVDGFLPTLKNPDEKKRSH